MLLEDGGLDLVRDRQPPPLDPRVRIFERLDDAHHPLHCFLGQSESCQCTHFSVGFDTTGIHISKSKEHRLKIGLGNIGRIVSEETKQKIREKAIGRADISFVFAVLFKVNCDAVLCYVVLFIRECIAE